MLISVPDWPIYTSGAIFHPIQRLTLRFDTNPNPDPFNTNYNLNPNPNLNHPNQNHTPRTDNSLEQIQLYASRDRKYHLQNQTVILIICVIIIHQVQAHYYYYTIEGRKLLQDKH